VFGTPDDPYFVGKDVAEILGYKDTKGAIQKHVYDEHKTTLERLETKVGPLSKTGEPKWLLDGLQAHTILKCAREWTTSFTNFQKLKSCERCSGRRGYDITVVRKFAAECGLKCLETKWKNNSVAMRWACLECKYKWTACYGNIARSTKRGCPKCQDAFRSTYVLADVHRICAEKKIRCLEKTYKDCGEHMEFECDRCDRRWTTSFRSIIQNLGCLKCNHKAAMRRR
jgi:hypothetical protein